MLHFLQRPCCLISLLIIPIVAVAQTQSAKSALATQGNANQETVRPIAPPKNPLPAEEASASVTKFSFIVYGDTRGRRDGKEIQYEHSLIVESMLHTIKKMDTTSYPIRFILQTGDAVVDGRDSKQWNTSFVNLINRLTTEGGVPYFLAPGNHDVTSASELNDPRRQDGLRNYLAAVSQLIPPDGALRRLAGYPTYAFGYGNTFFIAFDSNIANDEKQIEWVKNQLESLGRGRFPNVVAFCHHPPFSSGPHGGSRVEAPTVALRNRYMPLFRKYRVKALFVGHEHLFEHWVERYENAGKKYRLDLIVTGGGGAPLYSYHGEPDLSEYLNANKDSKAKLEHLVKPGYDRGDNAYHYTVIKVDGEQMSLEVIGVDWGNGYRPYQSNKADLRDPEVSLPKVKVETIAPRPEDVTTLDGIIKAFYETICGPKGQPRQWARDRTLYIPDTRFVSMEIRDGKPHAEIMDHQTYVDRTNDFFVREGFFEQEIHRVTKSFGNVTHVFSTYEMRQAFGGPVTGRGVNSIQLFYDGSRWWIISAAWDDERPDNPIPKEFLP
jgi:3',5'-cyclic AMP phosphodiesterase CpdA